MEENKIKAQDRIDRISRSIGGNFNSDQIVIIKNSVAKGVDDNELAFFLNLAHSLGLNPFNKEIWCYKDNKGNLLCFAGRDGFLKIGQKNQRWNGMYSCEVREKDKYEQIFKNGEATIRHEKHNDKSSIKGAFCYIKPKNTETATIEYVDFDTYNKGSYIWKSHPADMIKKVAEIKALKKAFGISGLYDENDFNLRGGSVSPIDTEHQVEPSVYAYIEKLMYSCTLDENQKCELELELESGITTVRADEIIMILKDCQISAVDRGNMSAKEIHYQLDIKDDENN